MAIFQILTESGSDTGFRWDEANGLVEHYLDGVNSLGNGSYVAVLLSGSKVQSSGPIGISIPQSVKAMIDAQVSNGLFTGIPSNVVLDDVTGGYVLDDITQSFVLAA